MAEQFGTSYIVDAYVICCSLPSVLFSVFASGFARSYQTIYVRIMNEKQKNLFFSNVVNILTCISILLAITCYAFSAELTNLLAPGFDVKTSELAASFIRIIIVYLPFSVVFNILCVQAYTRENFIFCNFCNYIVVNIIIIISIMLSSINVFFLIYGQVLAIAVATILLSIYLFSKKIFMYEFYISPFSNDFKQLCAMAIPIGGSVLINQINTVIDRVFASTLGVGITSSLCYADKIQLLPYTLVVSVIIIICTPRINTYFAQGDQNKGVFYIKLATLVTIYLSIPVVFILCPFSYPIVQLIFERGGFDTESTIITSSCLRFYALGIPFYAFREISSVALMANLRKDLILKNSIISILLNIIMNLVFVQSFGYLGLPLATSLSGMIVSAIIVRDMKKIDLSIFDTSIINDILKIIFVSFLSFAVVNCAMTVFSKIFIFKYNIILSITIFILIYIGFSIVLNIRIILFVYKNMFNTISKIFKK